MNAPSLPVAPTSSLVPSFPTLSGGLSLPSGRTVIMGTLNVTSGSFSDGGRYTDTTTVLHHTRAMAVAGVDLIDVGEELTRPNSIRIGADEEWARIYTIVKSLTTDGAIMSVNTLHASTACEAVCVDAVIINGVSGGRWGPEMSAATAESGYVYVVQHYRALPGVPGEYFDYGDDLMGTLIERVGSQVRDAIDVGVIADKAVVDPGLGFSLTGDRYWQIPRELLRFLQGGYPVFVGVSRKCFVRALDGDVDANGVDIATYRAAADTWTVWVHDVVATVAAITQKETDVD